jgi:uncharacterized protein YndB with AHSA1/START domain
MRFREKAEIRIEAPLETVWQAVQDFSSWHTWCSHVREATREGGGWRFRIHGQPPIDLIFVAEALQHQAPTYIEFRSMPEAKANLWVYGWIQLSHKENHTHVELLLEGEPHYEQAWLDKAAHWYANIFGEPNKVLKLTLEELKSHLEIGVPQDIDVPQANFVR